MTAPVVVVGGGHNGLVAACYLARAGERVLVPEQSARLGGGSRTEETVPGHRFDTHSVAHNILNMTSIPAELDLAGAGLRHLELDPFAAGFFADGRVARFYRSVDQTVAGLPEPEASAYAALMRKALPLVDVAVTGITGRPAVGQLPALARAVRRFGGPINLVHDLVSPTALSWNGIWPEP